MKKIYNILPTCCLLFLISNLILAKNNIYSSIGQIVLMVIILLGLVIANSVIPVKNK